MAGSEERLSCAEWRSARSHSGRNSRPKKTCCLPVVWGAAPSRGCKFSAAEDGSIGFRVGTYDVHHPLVIDPVFVFSTYLDGTNMDEVAAVTTDSAGNIYLSGTTGSTNFQIQGPEQSQLGCNTGVPTYCQNAFITKLDPTGKTLLYSTYLGGSAQDFGAAIAVDSRGDAIIGGVSTSSNFPKAGSVPSI